MLQVVKVIDEEAVPLLKRCSLAGHAQFKTSNPIFAEDDRAADMLIDILTDRGFSVAHTMDERVIPVRAMQCACKLVQPCTLMYRRCLCGTDLISFLAPCRRD